MLPEIMLRYGREDNAIRETAAYAAKRAAEIGAENVYNFSIGNPNVPAPDVVTASLRKLPDTVPPASCTPIPRAGTAAGPSRHRGRSEPALRHGLHRRGSLSHGRRLCRAW